MKIARQYFFIVLSLFLAVPAITNAQASADSIADLGASLVAGTETAQRLCTAFYFVNPRVIAQIEQDSFGFLGQVSQARAQELIKYQIDLTLEMVAKNGEKRWCYSYRTKMRSMGGLGVQLFEE